MGCNNSKGVKYDPSKGDAKAIDASTLSDPQQRVEKTFPFYRMHVKAFEEKLNDIGKDRFTITELAATLNTQAWAGQFGEGQDLNKLLNSLPDCGNDELDKISL